MSVRRAVARPTGIDDLDAAVARYPTSDLPDAMKAALRYADAYLADPGGLDEVEQRALREHYTPEQLVELAHKFVFHLGNKPNIALGFDSAVDADALSSFVYDEDGYFVVEGLGNINQATG